MNKSASGPKINRGARSKTGRLIHSFINKTDGDGAEKLKLEREKFILYTSLLQTEDV